jgi:nitrogen regulatory protein P-II 2
MKMVTAFIRPLRLDDVVDALEAIGVDKLTVTEVRGVGRTPPAKRSVPDESQTPQLPPRTKIEMAVTNETVSKVIEAIRVAAALGLAGDGKIFVGDLEDAVRIRTGERGELAL